MYVKLFDKNIKIWRHYLYSWRVKSIDGSSFLLKMGKKHNAHGFYFSLVLLHVCFPFIKVDYISFITVKQEGRLLPIFWFRV